MMMTADGQATTAQRRGTPTDAAAPHGNTAPDWQHQTHELHCPMCEYNLHGLADSRCPECGFRFEWSELLDPNRRAHPYLFEHHPEANFKSFWRTAWGGLRPSRFWRELHPVMPSRPRRLLLYWFLTVLVGSCACIGVMIPRASALSWGARQARQRAIMRSSPLSADLSTSLTPALQALVEQQFPLPPSLEFFDWLWQTEPTLRAAVALLAFCVAWPWLTFFTLMLFRFSMRRARVRTIHVLRCVLYSYDVMLWAGAILLVVLPLAGWVFGTGEPGAANTGWNGPTLDPYAPGRPPAGFGYLQSLTWGSGFLPWSNLLVAGLLAIAPMRLIVAYRRYLKFDWPAATVLVSQGILVLLLSVLLINVPRDIYGDVLTGYWRHLMGLPQW
jgi:hypothetical protein